MSQPSSSAGEIKEEVRYNNGIKYNIYCPIARGYKTEMAVPFSKLVLAMPLMLPHQGIIPFYDLYHLDIFKESSGDKNLCGEFNRQLS